eukprot:scaffold34645_cov201-Amphora_coffeaeformis.AAC.3
MSHTWMRERNVRNHANATEMMQRSCQGIISAGSAPALSTAFIFYLYKTPLGVSLSANMTQSNTWWRPRRRFHFLFSLVCVDFCFDCNSAMKVCKKDHPQKRYSPLAPLLGGDHQRIDLAAPSVSEQYTRPRLLSSSITP